MPAVPRPCGGARHQLKSTTETNLWASAIRANPTAADPLYDYCRATRSGVGTISLRHRREGDLGSMELEPFVNRVLEEIARSGVDKQTGVHVHDYSTRMVVNCLSISRILEKLEHDLRFATIPRSGIHTWYVGQG